ncbi:MAG: methyltransferase [Firmicutes bacterium]|nr:methyltransferase [Bacillota bacterium]
MSKAGKGVLQEGHAAAPDYVLEDLQTNGLWIYQSEAYFRFGTDAVALAHFAKAKGKDIVLDIGSGSGIVPLLMAGKFGVRKVYGVELQEPLCRMSRQSIAYNGLQQQIQIIEDKAQNIATHFESGFATLVTANPPYYKVDGGDSAINPSVAMSRTEHTLSLHDTVQCAKYALSTGGRFCIVHKVERLAEVIHECKLAKLEPKRLQLLLPKLFLMECKKDGGVGLKIEK